LGKAYLCRYLAKQTEANPLLKDLLERFFYTLQPSSSNVPHKIITKNSNQVISTNLRLKE
jgi:hypothetical protein